MKKIALALASLWALSDGTAYPAEEEPGVLILLAPGFQWHEFWVPYGCLRAAGYRVDVAAAVTAERVVTVHGADGIGEAMRLLASMFQPGAARFPAGRASAKGEPR